MGSHMVHTLCLGKNHASQTIEKYPKSNNTICELQNKVHTDRVLWASSGISVVFWNHFVLFNIGKQKGTCCQPRSLRLIKSLCCSLAHDPCIVWVMPSYSAARFPTAKFVCDVSCVWYGRLFTTCILEYMYMHRHVKQFSFKVSFALFCAYLGVKIALMSENKMPIIPGKKIGDSN